jgi:hypothetical protein
MVRIDGIAPGSPVRIRFVRSKDATFDDLVVSLDIDSPAAQPPGMVIGRS